MPPPLLPEELSALDAVFCTHAHGDHMDPGTLAPLARPTPAADSSFPLGPGGCRRAGSAAGADDHGRRRRKRHSGRGNPLARPGLGARGAGDRRGRLPDVPGLRPGLQRPPPVPQRRLRALSGPGRRAPPARGRCGDPAGQRARRGAAAAGILGNFTFDEAVELCRQAGIDAMLACHFGMFDFNTVGEEWLEGRIAALASPPQCVRPSVAAAYQFTPPATLDKLRRAP